MRAAILYAKELVRVEEIEPPRFGAGRGANPHRGRLDLRDGPQSLQTGLPCKDDRAAGSVRHELAGVIVKAAPDAELGMKNGGWASGSWRPIRHRAASVSLRRVREPVRRLAVPERGLCGIHCRPGARGEKNLLRLKPETEFRDAALVEPLACVVQGLEDTRLRPGQRVLVSAPGRLD